MIACPSLVIALTSAIFTAVALLSLMIVYMKFCKVYKHTRQLRSGSLGRQRTLLSL